MMRAVIDTCHAVGRQEKEAVILNLDSQLEFPRRRTSGHMRLFPWRITLEGKTPPQCGHHQAPRVVFQAEFKKGQEKREQVHICICLAQLPDCRCNMAACLTLLPPSYIHSLATPSKP